jgi:hypothetical protein
VSHRDGASHAHGSFPEDFPNDPKEIDMQSTLDTARVEAFAGRMLGDLGATVTGALVYLGDRLGLYRALASGPVTSAELAERTGTAERYVREWLANQAASGYVLYEPATQRFALPAEHAAVLADETSPAFMAGGFGSGKLWLPSPWLRGEGRTSGEGIVKCSRWSHRSTGNGMVRRTDRVNWGPSVAGGQGLAA